MPKGVFERKSIEVRFMEKVSPEPNSGCWLWDGAHHKDGYGSIGYKGKIRIAHRVAYQIYRGEIPAGINVCHRCDNRACVNPDHLFLGTHQQNMSDRNAKTRQSRGATHGPAKLTEDDVKSIRVTPGLSQRALAARFGVSRRLVRSILAGEKWAHLQ